MEKKGICEKEKKELHWIVTERHLGATFSTGRALCHFSLLHRGGAALLK